MEQTSVSHTSSRNPYFVNAFTDFMFIGGLSLLYFLMNKFFLQPQREQTWVFHISSWLVWVVNWPHFSATSYRLYHSGKNMKQYPVTAFLVPVMVVLGVIFSLNDVESFAPYFVKFFLIWSPYHFSGQTLGITLLYARRSGVQIQGMFRFILGAFIFSTYLLSVLRAEISINGTSYFAVKVPSFGVPGWFVDGVMYWMVLTGVIFLGYLGKVFFKRYQLSKSFSTIPWILVTPTLAQFIWFVPGIYVPSFQEFVPAFHSLQYLLIAFSMHVFESFQTQKAEFNPVKLFSVKTFKWSAVNILGGAILFYFLPRWGSTLSGVPLSIAEGIIVSGVQIHHFFVDGVIWKLRTETVMSPLMMSFGEIFTNKKTTFA